MKFILIIFSFVTLLLPVKLIAQPEASITSDDISICGDGNVEMTVAFTGTPPFKLVYKHDVSTYSTQNPIYADNITIELPFDITTKSTVQLLEVYDGNNTLGTILDGEMVVTVDVMPTVNAGADIAVCGYEYELKATITGTTTNITWIDPTSSGSFNDPSLATATYTNSTPGTYNLVLNVENGACPASDDVTITLMGRPQGSIADRNTETFCSSKGLHSVDIPLTFEGEAPFTYQLQNESEQYVAQTSTGTSDTRTINVTQTENISFYSIEDVQGCTAEPEDMAGSKAIVDVKPNVYAGEDITANCGSEFTLNAAVSDGTTGLWSSSHPDVSFDDATNANTTVSMNFAADDLYKDATLTWTETTTDEHNCANFDNFDIKFVQKPTVAIGSVTDDNICEDLSVSLNLDVTGNKPLSVDYNLGGSTFNSALTEVAPKLTVLGADLDIGNNTISITKISDSFGCFKEYSDVSQAVLVDAMPYPNAGPDDESCEKGIQLQADEPVVGTGVWSGTPGEYDDATNPETYFTANNFDENPGEGQILTWTITNGKCVNSDDVVIQFHKAPWPVNAGPNDTIYHVNTYTLQADQPDEGNTYYWEVLKEVETIAPIPTEPNSVLSDLKNGEYQLKWVVSNESGKCPEVTDTVTLLVRPLFSPTGISPNGDGINEYFVIKGLADISNNTLTVFNKNGKQVYKTKNYENNWAGTDQSGAKLPAGTYYYVFEGDELSSPVRDYLIIRR